MHVRDLVANHLSPKQTKNAMLDSELSLVLWDQACPIAAEALLGGRLRSLQWRVRTRGDLAA